MGAGRPYLTAMHDPAFGPTLLARPERDPANYYLAPVPDDVAEDRPAGWADLYYQGPDGPPLRCARGLPGDFTVIDLPAGVDLRAVSDIYAAVAERPA